MRKLIILLILFGCGYFYEGDENIDAVYKIAAIQCEVDPNFIYSFFSKDVSSDLNCLRSKLKNVEMVSKEDDDFVTKEELLLIMKKLNFEINDQMKVGITSLFKFVTLAKNFDDSKLALKDIDSLFDLFVKFNQLVVSDLTRIKITTFIQDLNNFFVESDRIVEIPDNQKLLIMVKKLFIGGSDIVLVSDIKIMLEKFKLIAEDILPPSFNDWKSLNLVKVKNYFYMGSSEVVLLSSTDLVDQILRFIPFAKSVNKDDFYQVVSSFKKKLFTSDTTDLLISDVMKIVDWSSEYALFMQAANDFVENNFVTTNEYFSYDLNLVYRNLHNYRDNQGYQYFTANRHFSKEGFIQVLNVYFLIKKVQSAYGYFLNNEYYLNFEQLDELVKLFRPLLIPLKLWPSEDLIMTRSILLINGVAMNSSDGKMDVSTMELTEFLEIILTANKIRPLLMNEVERDCESFTTGDEIQYDTECVCKNYFNYFYSLKLSKYLPRLAEYAKSGENAYSYACKLAVLMMKEIDGEVKRPILEREIFMMTMTILAIESTYLKYDTSNNNNNIESSEAVAAYKWFKDIFLYLKKVDEDDADYAEAFFYYLLINKKVPGMIRLYFNSASDLINNVPDISRKDIAEMILVALEYI